MKKQLPVTLLFVAFSLLAQFQFALPYPVSIVLLLIGILIVPDCESLDRAN